MRKLIILKSLVDFIWILTCIPLIPLVLFFAVTVFLGLDTIRIVPSFDIDGAELDTWPFKATVLISLVIIYVNIYCVFLFRKTLRYFQRVKPFHLTVINNFDIIGKLLLYSGLISSVLAFVFKVYFNNEVSLSLGFSPYIFMICLGLFFMVLSETFKIAKTAKEENDLTV